MNLSSILVTTTERHFESTIAALVEVDGLEVHYGDAASGRIVVTHEGEDVAVEVAALHQIKSLPHVVFAEMVYHYIEDDHLNADGESDGLDVMHLASSQNQCGCG